MESQLFILRKELCDILNIYDLPLDIKYFVVKDILNEVETTLHAYLQSQEVNNMLKQEQNNSQPPEDIQLDLGDVIAQNASQEEWEAAKKRVDEKMAAAAQTSDTVENKTE